MNTLSITKNTDGQTLTVDIAGRIDTATSPTLDNEIKSSSDGITKIILNFEQVEYISSSGLRVLISLHKTMSAKNGRLVIRKPTEMVAEVFDVTGFADILFIED